MRISLLPQDLLTLIFIILKLGLSLLMVNSCSLLENYTFPEEMRFNDPQYARIWPTYFSNS